MRRPEKEAFVASREEKDSRGCQVSGHEGRELFCRSLCFTGGG